MNGIINLSDAELQRCYRNAVDELARRCPLTAIDATAIKGQETCKRALAVAIAGGHSILFFGPHGCGKSMLRSVGRSLGLTESFEDTQCPCGNTNNPKAECHCPRDDIAAHQSQFPEADIICEVPPVPMRELQDYRGGTSSAQIKESADIDRDQRPTKLDSDAETLLRSAAIEMDMSPRRVSIAVEVGGTIAAMDKSPIIRSVHIMEAINYRFPFFS